MAEKDSLAEEGFPDWQRRHFQSFIKGVERFGRDSLDKVAFEIADKSEEEVRAYAKVFFERYSEVESESIFDISSAQNSRQILTDLSSVSRLERQNCANSKNESMPFIRKSDRVASPCRSSNSPMVKTRERLIPKRRTDSCWSGCTIMVLTGTIATSW